MLSFSSRYDVRGFLGFEISAWNKFEFRISNISKSFESLKWTQVYKFEFFLMIKTINFQISIKTRYLHR